jgi:hypothetical protein
MFPEKVYIEIILLVFMDFYSGTMHRKRTSVERAVVGGCCGAKG